MTVDADRPWWHTAVVYQIYPRSWQDADADGVGDLAGITRRLDHLTWLGVDAVWLSPIFVSPMEDGGYDVVDHTAVDPLFGTLDDLDALVAAAHRRGLRVVLDFVPNHTSHRHPWFLESRSSRDNPLRDWYVWREPAPGGGPPTNWRSATDVTRPGSAWTWDERTGQYHLGTFSPLQPDLRWATPGVREAMCDVLRFWLDRGVDGFRVDMADFLGKDPHFRDEAVPADDYFLEARHHRHRPGTLDHLRAIRATVDEYADRVLIGEMLYGARVGQLVEHTVAAGVDLPTNFSLITSPLDAQVLADHIDAYDAALRDADAWPNWCVGNHDQPRVGSRGPRHARLALLLLLTLRGTPFLYYGDEIGMTNTDVPPDRRHDPFVVPQHDIPRDAVRTPMQWDAGPNAGFCPAGVEPWLPLAADHRSVNVAAECDDASSTLTFVRHLLALRRRLPALSLGSYRRLTDVPGGCLAFERRQGGSRVVVALDLAGRGAALDVDELRGGRLLASTVPHEPGSYRSRRRSGAQNGASRSRGPGSGGQPWRLEPLEGVVVESP